MKPSRLNLRVKLAIVSAAAVLTSMGSGQAIAYACTQADISACHQVCGTPRLYDPVWQACFKACINGRCGSG